ncbi:MULTISPECIES: hypothetical protein [unclassified Rhizobium]|uniref:hypothetical protein n=1 Tax=unclassified Rhizobium TaxID=2613769 RepID=UPI00160EAFFA|nr:MULTISPECIES: hypothetical protein [unclassified Rhizobium]MBB3386333.1 hypothetical protein [Rhizobium sp. BK098]MBB3618142.1 hypothetical protein [Rhizobium sp. BK609]MBB3683694.1 hypothetical protein [Rhizobium sp. BK612]
MRGTRPYPGGVLFAIFCLIVAGWPASVAAHGGGSSGSQAGIPIPSLTHGEMAVIAPYYGRIISIAESVSDTDETFRRLLNFAQIQRAYCLWGLMPGSVSDEESPFNECSHAYLAAAKAVLLQMRVMKVEKASVDDLVSDIDATLVRNNLSLVLCKFSGESFNTADLIRPKLADIALHAKSLAAILSASLLVLAGLWLGARALRPQAQP